MDHCSAVVEKDIEQWEGCRSKAAFLAHGEEELKQAIFYHSKGCWDWILVSEWNFTCLSRLSLRTLIQELGLVPGKGQSGFICDYHAVQTAHIP